ncbi:unnamed protein product [Penicillium glandicola]
MRFDYYAVALGLFGTAFSYDPEFNPITRPTLGETIYAGTVYTIEWNVSTQGQSGPINIELKTIGSSHITGNEATISTDAKSTDGKFQWNVGGTLPSSGNYYIRISYIDDIDIYNESPFFNIKASNESISTTSSSKTPITMKSATTSPISTIIASTSSNGTYSQTATTATSTSSGAGATATPIFAALLAFVGVVAAGMLAF